MTKTIVTALMIGFWGDSVRRHGGGTADDDDHRLVRKRLFGLVLPEKEGF